MNEIDELLRDAGARLRRTAPSAAATEAARTTLGDVRVDGSAELGRRRRWIVPALLAAAAIVVGLVVLNRPPDESIGPVDTTSPAIETVPTTVPSTVPTTVPTTTPTSVPTSVATAAPWVDIPFEGMMAPPCCAEMEIEPVSPALTPDGEPLADGRYAGEIVEWSADDPSRLVIGVHRFVPCSEELPNDCYPDEAGAFPPGAVGVSPETRTIELTLDESVDALLVGMDPDAPPDVEAATVRRRSDGTGLAQLLTEVAQAYDAAIAAPILAGTPVEDVVADLQQSPRNGFSSAQEGFFGQLFYSPSEGAPAILFQGVADQGAPLPRSGTSAIIFGGVEVVDGRLALHLYAGFRS
jgi:hypothetical protein